jgi:hypothetical protein
MLTGSVPSKRRQIRSCILGALLLAFAATAAGEPVRPIHKKKPVAAAKQVESPPPTPTVAISAVSANPQRPRYLRPFELDFATHLEKSSAATLPAFQAEPDVRAGAPNGPLNQAAQIDSYGLLSSSVRPQAPQLVTIGEWSFSAAAHVPVTHSRDTGAAISAEHGF